MELVQQFAQGQNELGHKFRIVVTLLSSFNFAYPTQLIYTKAI